MKKKNNKKRGAAQLIVIGALLVVSLLSAYIVQVLQADTFQIHSYSLQMKAYYLASEAASASVSALLADDDVSLLNTGLFPMSDELEHTDNGVPIGHSDIEMHLEQHLYYEDMKNWVIITVTTTIPDDRASRLGEDFTYTAYVMVLVDNPLIQLYNINPSDMA